MRRRSFTWFLLSVACFLGAFYFWRLGDEWQAQKAASKHSPTQTVQPPRIQSPALVQPIVAPSGGSLNEPKAAVQTNSSGAIDKRAAQLKYRLSNTPQSMDELVG